MSVLIETANQAATDHFNKELNKKNAGALFCVGISPGKELVLVTTIDVTKQQALEALKNVITIIERDYV